MLLCRVDLAFDVCISGELKFVFVAASALDEESLSFLFSFSFSFSFSGFLKFKF